MDKSAQHSRIYWEPQVPKHLVEAIYDAIEPELKIEIERQFRLLAGGIARGSENPGRYPGAAARHMCDLKISVQAQTNYQRF